MATLKGLAHFKIMNVLMYINEYALKIGDKMRGPKSPTAHIHLVFFLKLCMDRNGLPVASNQNTGTNICVISPVILL